MKESERLISEAQLNIKQGSAEITKLKENLPKNSQDKARMENSIKALEDELRKLTECCELYQTSPDNDELKNDVEHAIHDFKEGMAKAVSTSRSKP